MHLRASPRGSKLVVSWDTLVHLDVLTLDGLLASIDRAVEAISALERDAEREHRRGALRIVGDPG